MILQDLEALQSEEGLEAQQVRLTRTRYHVSDSMSQAMQISFIQLFADWRPKQYLDPD